jgi:hypothetical protein
VGISCCWSRRTSLRSTTPSACSSTRPPAWPPCLWWSSGRHRRTTVGLAGRTRYATSTGRFNRPERLRRLAGAGAGLPSPAHLARARPIQTGAALRDHRPGARGGATGAALSAEARALAHRDGLIINDKFCFTRRTSLTWSQHRRPRRVTPSALLEGARAQTGGDDGDEVDHPSAERRAERGAAALGPSAPAPLAVGEPAEPAGDG